MKNSTQTNNFDKVIFFFFFAMVTQRKAFLSLLFTVFTIVMMTSPLSSYAARFKVVAFSEGYIEGDVIRYVALEVNNCYFS